MSTLWASISNWSYTAPYTAACEQAGFCFKQHKIWKVITKGGAHTVKSKYIVSLKAHLCSTLKTDAFHPSVIYVDYVIRFRGPRGCLPDGANSTTGDHGGGAKQDSWPETSKRNKEEETATYLMAPQTTAIYRLYVTVNGHHRNLLHGLHVCDSLEVMSEHGGELCTAP